MGRVYKRHGERAHILKILSDQRGRLKSDEIKYQGALSAYLDFDKRMVNL